MGKRGSRKQTEQWRAVTACALLFLVAFPTFTAGAIPPPTRPYTVTRWVDAWEYNAGEPLDITLRVVYNNIEVSDALYLQINEMFSPSPENWEYLSLVDADGRVTYEPSPPGAGNTHNFTVNITDGFPDFFEFTYQVAVPEDITDLVRITAFPEITFSDASQTTLATAVTDLYPPGLPEIDEDDGEALDNYISQLRQQGDEEGWDFEVGANNVITRTPASLLGTNASFMPAKQERKAVTFPKVNPKELPPKFDWRDREPEVPVADQGNCGSCWAFSLVSVAEKLVAIKDNVHVKFSAQWVLDCNTNGWNCNGGWNPYEMFIDTDECGIQGLVLEAVLPYQEAEIGCDCDKDRIPPYAFGYVGPISEDQPLEDKILAIKQAVMQYGPVWTTVYAGHAPFLAYAGGVFNYKPTDGSIDHAVVIEGWDDTRGAAGVWIMRNSWGELWGEKGYMLIEYDSSLIGSYTDVISYAGSSNGSITVTIEPQAAITAGAQWRVDDGSWFNSGETLPNMAPGAYTINYKTIEGFTAPADETVQLDAQEALTLTGAYVENVEGEGEGEGEGEAVLPETLDEIAEFLLDEYDNVDANKDGKLTFDEASNTLPDLTPSQFSALDLDGDGSLTSAELREYIAGPSDSGCCGSCDKSGTWKQHIKRQMGDWLLVGITLLTLMCLNHHRRGV